MGFTRYWVQIPPFKLALHFYSCYVWNNWIVKLIRWLNGAKEKFKRIRSGKETRYVAEVSKVLVHPQLAFAYNSSHTNYISWPSGFITWSQLLSRNVTLLSLSYKDQVAAFAVFDDNEKIYDSRKHPFLWVSQAMLAKEVVTIPLNLFHELMDSVDVSSKTLVFMSMTPRSGSTIWSQIFNSLPGWGSISEIQSTANVFFNDVDDAESFMATSDYEDMIKSAMKFHFLNFPEKDNLFVKATFGEYFAIEAVAKHFPNSKILFSYREALPCGDSYHRLFNNFDFYRYFMDILREIPETANPIAYKFKTGFHHNMKPFREALVKERPQCLGELSMLVWSQNLTLALRALENGVGVKGVKYERFMKQKEETVSKVFEYVGVDPTLVQTALDSMKQDSQSASPVSQEKLKSVPRWEHTRESLTRCNRILNSFGFPDVTCSYNFPNEL